MKRDNEKPPATNGLRVSRRGFLSSIGAGAVTVAASGRLFAADRTDETQPVAASELTRIRLKVNARSYDLLVEPRWTLIHVLREIIGFTGSKESCGRGECGACTVLIDGIARYACMTLAVEVQESDITTVEGLMDGESLGPVQSAFAEQDAFQCGYCTSGQIMSVEGLLRKNSSPSVEEIRTAISGNLCRCGAYSHIVKAAQKATKERK